MRWELTLHGGDDHGKRIIFEAESVEEAKMRAVEEVKRRNARLYELSRLL
ncbi:hypothetical protein [Thermococcus gorgonarius]|nr:hypothetical protein [Thermococcus gorgonarius]